jgi:hypothetical protein
MELLLGLLRVPKVFRLITQIYEDRVDNEAGAQRGQQLRCVGDVTPKQPINHFLS